MLALMTGSATIGGGPNKGLTDDGRLGRALMTVRMTLGRRIVQGDLALTEMTHATIMARDLGEIKMVEFMNGFLWTKSC